MMEAYENLANAIILQAVKDYRFTLKRLVKHPHDNTALRTKREIECFFNYGLFSMLTTINLEILIWKLHEEVDR